jgi:hypothetical protein
VPASHRLWWASLESLVVCSASCERTSCCNASYIRFISSHQPLSERIMLYSELWCRVCSPELSAQLVLCCLMS